MDTENKTAALGCLIFVVLILGGAGIFAIAEEEYSIAFLYCIPFIFTALFYLIEHKSMSKDSKSVVEGCLILLSLFYTISGFVSIVFGDFFNSFLLFIPLICCILFGVYYWILIVPINKELDLMRKMHKIPRTIDKEDGSQWGNAFQQLINSKLKDVTESEKKGDLQQCQHIVTKMTKDKAFEKLNRAFRLTGCHLSITDAAGNPITKIV